VAAMYAPDAIMITRDGGVLFGGDAIRKTLNVNTPDWPRLTINSDSLRVVGNTAWDIGTSRARGPGGTEHVSRYLVVLRRGMKDWKINSLAQVPEIADSVSAMKIRPAGQ
jgi:ketosteroid isomerase-like protein